MDKIITKTVGSKEHPIQIYWEFEGKKIDHSLMVTSITSGCYGFEHFDYDTFTRHAKHFIRYARRDEKYYKQLKYILENSNPDCSDFLYNLIKSKWNIDIEFENLYCCCGIA